MPVLLAKQINTFLLKSRSCDKLLQSACRRYSLADNINQTHSPKGQILRYPNKMTGERNKTQDVARDWNLPRQTLVGISFLGPIPPPRKLFAPRFISVKHASLTHPTGSCDMWRILKDVWWHERQLRLEEGEKKSGEWKQASVFSTNTCILLPRIYQLWKFQSGTECGVYTRPCETNTDKAYRYGWRSNRQTHSLCGITRDWPPPIIAMYHPMGVQRI